MATTKHQMDLGKSAIFEAILWCLFNKCRVQAMDDIIFWGETACQVAFTFQHSGDLFKIVRKRNRISSTSGVEFYKQDSNLNWVNISGSTTSLTNSEIINTLKLDAKTFVNSAYFRQNDISEFADSDASRKKEILKSIIDLSKWDEYERVAKNNLKDLSVDLKILSSKLEGYDLAVINLEHNEKMLWDLTGSLKIKHEAHAALAEQLKVLTEKYIHLKSTLNTGKWDETISEQEKITKEIGKLKAKLKVIESSIVEYDKKFLSKTQEIAAIKEKVDELVIDENIDDKIKQAQNEIIEFKASHATSKSLVLEKRNIIINVGSCYVCQQEITDELERALSSKHQETIKTYEHNIVYCETKIKELNLKLLGFEQFKLNKKKKDAYISKINTLVSESNIEKERGEELITERDFIFNELQELSTKLMAINQVLESLKNDDFKQLQVNINKMKTEFSLLAEDLDNSNRLFGALSEKVKTLTLSVKQFADSQKLYLEKQKQIIVFEKMIKLLGKNGVQTILLNAMIEDLEKSANNILSSICNEPFIIFLETQRSGSDGISVVDTLDLRVKKDGIVQNFKSLSGGEQFRISLALRIALSEICCRHGGSSLEFLLLDEVNSQLDKQGTESLFLNVIKSLEKKYKILVITHNDSLKERFNNIIDVSKKNGESSVNFVSI